MNRENTNLYIEYIFDKYKDDESFLLLFSDKLKKIEDTIISYKQDLKDRENRKSILNDEKELFISTFLKEHKYYYIPESDIFVEYDDENYKQVDENKIWCEILKPIYNTHTLTPWKQRVRVEIIALLK